MLLIYRVNIVRPYDCRRSKNTWQYRHFVNVTSVLKERRPVKANNTKLNSTSTRHMVLRLERGCR